MRFFEVDSAVDAIMSAAMLAQTKAGSRNQQGQLSMNGFLQMLKNAGIMMDYEGFKTVYDTNPQLANVIEKFDKDTVTFMSADGNDKAIDNTKQSNQPSPDERITQMARSAVRTREFKEAIGESGILYKGGVNKYGKEGTTRPDIDVEVNEAEDLEKINAGKMRRRIADIRFMVAEMEDQISELVHLDNGDLTDQIRTMMKYSEGLYSVLSRAMKIVPVYEGEMNEALGARQIAEIDKKYEELTDENQHGEAALLLVNAFGDKEELDIINAINARHKKRGSIMPSEQKLRDEIANSHYKTMKQGLFPINTSATQGKRMGADGPDEEQRDRTRAANTDEGFASDGQRKAAFASGYKPKGKKKMESMQSKFKNFLVGKK